MAPRRLARCRSAGEGRHPGAGGQKDRNSSHHHHDAKPNHANPIACIRFSGEPRFAASEFTQNLRDQVVHTFQALSVRQLGWRSARAGTTQEIAVGSFPVRFFSSLFARLTQWFADTTNGITKIVTELLAAKRVETQELCVDDICITRDQFAEVFGGSQPAAADAPEVSGTGAPASGAAESATAAAGDVATTPTLTEQPTPELEQELAPANDNQPPEELPSTGTE